jgi:hypothetical protein
MDDLVAVAVTLEDSEGRPLLGFSTGTGFSGLALAKAKILFRIAFDMSSCSLRVLWGTAAFLSSIVGCPLSPRLKNQIEE